MKTNPDLLNETKTKLKRCDKSENQFSIYFTRLVFDTYHQVSKEK